MHFADLQKQTNSRWMPVHFSMRFTFSLIRLYNQPHVTIIYYVTV